MSGSLRELAACRGCNGHRAREALTENEREACVRPIQSRHEPTAEVAAREAYRAFASEFELYCSRRQARPFGSRGHGTSQLSPCADKMVGPEGGLSELERLLEQRLSLGWPADVQIVCWT